MLSGCGGPKQKTEVSNFEKLTGDFVYSTLAFSPVAATSVGYHQHDGTVLDSALDDLSAQGLERQRKYFHEWKNRLESMDQSALDPEAKADLELMQNQVDLSLLDLDTVQSFAHNPTVYVELIGNALFTPYSVEYAPEAQRYQHIIDRLKAVPGFLAEARKNLVDSNAVWTRVAIEESEGNLALVEKVFPAKVPADKKAEYNQVAKNAIDSMHSFNEYLKTLKDAGPDGWRLGKANYDAKFKLVIGSDATPEQLLVDAENELLAVRKKMFMLSLPIHVKYYPTHKDPVDLNLIVGETLEKIAQKHVKADGYFQEAEKTLAETRAFMKSHEDKIVKMPGQDNLKLIETPEFMRGIYGVGGFNPAPALQPELGAFYWLTPIPKSWPKDRVESKLREYNDYGLRVLTIHEAIPGHYVQLEYANAVQPKSRRVLRAVFGSGPYVEGWAVYATDVMINEGYMDKNPEMALTWCKQQLRAIANTILDIKMQTMGMTDDEAMRLMLEKTFQEKEEATAKLQRAKLSSCQLPTYFAGYRAWKQLRAAAEKTDGAKFVAGEFHRKALAAGALPMPTLGRLLGYSGGAAR
ncbi:DUF885 domain-containing protein [uncultured Paludibaculum sp.]|uniref:DUF885 domain-containing protein n=1 Tax=uncultured Paludibaculum sp. TaxID=1765020 RepID=UPI002AAB2625|nr:DUF885 domain-containing protein [uncultured Paludibaculum sp.]